MIDWVGLWTGDSRWGLRAIYKRILATPPLYLFLIIGRFDALDRDHCSQKIKKALSFWPSLENQGEVPKCHTSQIHFCRQGFYTLIRQKAITPNIFCSPEFLEFAKYSAGGLFGNLTGNLV